MAYNRKPDENGLTTDKQRRFVEEYLIDKNATQAAIRAKYSKRTAQRMGSENLSKPPIKAAIEAGLEKLRYKADVSARRVLEELKCLSYADPGQLFDELKAGSLIPPYKLPEALRRAISGIDVVEKTTKRGVKTVTYKYKFWDKNKALDMINRHVGLYELDNEQRQPVILQAPVVEKGGGKPAIEDHSQK
jgi:phage terminase small subunit